jgi:hypothetical protein
LSTRPPYSIVTVMARIRGDVSESKLREAVLKVQQRHPNLRFGSPRMLVAIHGQLRKG